MTTRFWFTLLLLLCAGRASAAGLATLQDRAAATSPKPGPGDYQHSLDAGGLKRRYEVHVPPSYKPGRAVAAVVFFHGLGGSADMSREGTRFDGKADEDGFLMVYPDGTSSGPGRPRTWNAGGCCGHASMTGVDDIGFFEKLLDDLRTHFDVDPKRVYVTGFSNGGMFCHRLGCELPGRIAAIASVAGAMAVPSCDPKQPVRVLHVHATGDKVESYEPVDTGTPFASAKATAARWAAASGCAPVPVEKPLATRARIATYSPKPGGRQVTLITLEGGGHFWPSTTEKVRNEVPAKDFIDFDATDYICRFFGLQ